jgi:hypothetical protein
MHYRLRNRINNSNFSIQVLDHFPEALSDQALHDDEIYISRSIEYLKWRYEQNPRRKFIILGLYENGALKGVSVSTIIFSTYNQQDEGVIVDWIFNDRDQVDVHRSIIFGLTVKYLAQQNVKLVHVYTYDNCSSEDLSSRGFYEREEALTLYTYSADNDLAELLYNDNLWILTEGDSDTDLF